ncbi:S-adenosyl-L-methionine-dependent methyltransferase, partial [Ramaria rubella]
MAVPRGSKTSLSPSAVSSIPTSSGGTGESGAGDASKRRRIGPRSQGFIMRNGKRHHPQPKEQAPYPRDYERRTLDHDVWEHLFALQLTRSTTFHLFPTPPTKVLDLGCGTGEWILDCAREWKHTTFVGVDLVPIQPDLARLHCPTLAARITWVLANFLEPLPFKSGDFDFVHVRRVARGVPEDRWDAFMEEVVRVLRPGGAFEMLEEDLFFPGSVLRDEWEGDEGG